MVFSYQPLLPSDLWTKTGKKFGSLIEFTSTKPVGCLENSCVVRHHNVLFCYVLPLTILLPPIIYFGLSPYRHNKCQEMKAAVQTACTEYKREFKVQNVQLHSSSSAQLATAQCIESPAKFCCTIVKGCLSAQLPLPEPIWTQLQIDLQPKKAGEKWD